jgi:hypothetical protein
MIGVLGACIDIDETWTGTMQGGGSRRTKLYWFNQICSQHVLWQCHRSVFYERGLIRQGKHNLPQGHESRNPGWIWNARLISVVGTLLSGLHCIYEQENGQNKISRICAKHVGKPGHLEAWTKTTHGAKHANTTNNHNATSHKRNCRNFFHRLLTSSPDSVSAIAEACFSR